jgi:hypothetical protein
MATEMAREQGRRIGKGAKHAPESCWQWRKANKSNENPKKKEKEKKEEAREEQRRGKKRKEKSMETLYFFFFNTCPQRVRGGKIRICDLHFIRHGL